MKIRREIRVFLALVGVASVGAVSADVRIWDVRKLGELHDISGTHVDFSYRAEFIPGPNDNDRSYQTKYLGYHVNENGRWYCPRWIWSTSWSTEATKMCQTGPSPIDSMVRSEAERDWLKHSLGGLYYGQYTRGLFEYAGDLCVTWGVSSAPSAPPEPPTTGQACAGGGPPQPEVVCTVEGNLELNFRVAPSGFDSSMVRNLTLMCTQDSFVTVSSTSGGVIPFAWGNAVVSVNGSSLPARIRAAPSANLSVGVRVRGGGADPGLYVGAMTLVITPE